MPTTPSDNRDEILISLGEIKGQLAGFIASQAAQDRRMDRKMWLEKQSHTTPT